MEGDEKHRFWFESIQLRDHSEDLCVDGRALFKWIMG
jgi:hypothetical protein